MRAGFYGAQTPRVFVIRVIIPGHFHAISATPTATNSVNVLIQDAGGTLYTVGVGSPNANQAFRLDSLNITGAPISGVTATDGSVATTSDLASPTSTDSGGATTSTGGSETRPVNTYVTWIIKLDNDESVEVAVAPNVFPAGMISSFCSTNIPDGWLECDGSSVPVSIYEDLFDAIGYTYGGSGANFTIPSYQGMFLRGKDDLAENDFDSLIDCKDSFPNQALKNSHKPLPQESTAAFT